MIKYLYCLVSEASDLYYEQTYISIFSLRLHNANASVSLLIDNRTNKTLTGNRKCICDIVDEIIVIDFSEEIGNHERSRWLKTNMRNYASGDFLYIDGDTIICEPLDDISKMPFDLAAVAEQHTTLQNLAFYDGVKKLFQKLSNDPLFYYHSDYFNGGVLWVRDTEANHRFFDSWHANWKIGKSKGINIDMPSLAFSNYQAKFPIQALNGCWNCQIWSGANYLHSAKILHYFASIKSPYEPFSTKLPNSLKKTGVLSEESINIIASPKGRIKEPSFIVSGDEYYVFRSSLCGLVRFLYKRKILFNLINHLLYPMRVMHFWKQRKR